MNSKKTSGENVPKRHEAKSTTLSPKLTRSLRDSSKKDPNNTDRQERQERDIDLLFEEKCKGGTTPLSPASRDALLNLDKVLTSRLLVPQNRRPIFVSPQHHQIRGVTPLGDAAHRLTPAINALAEGPEKTKDGGIRHLAALAQVSSLARVFASLHALALRKNLRDDEKLTIEAILQRSEPLENALPRSLDQQRNQVAASLLQLTKQVSEKKADRPSADFGKFLLQACVEDKQLRSLLSKSPYVRYQLSLAAPTSVLHWVWLDKDQHPKAMAPGQSATHEQLAVDYLLDWSPSKSQIFTRLRSGTVHEVKRGKSRIFVQEHLSDVRLAADGLPATSWRILLCLPEHISGSSLTLKYKEKIEGNADLNIPQY